MQSLSYFYNGTVSLTELNITAQGCSEGYTGDGCSSCQSGYYRLEDSCYKCPRGAAGLIVAEIFAITALVLVAWFLKRRGVNMAVVSIGLDFLQILSIFTSLNFKWPSQLRTLFQLSSASTFNTQVLAPECSISGWSFAAKWYSIQAIPVMLMLPLLMTGIVVYCTVCSQFSVNFYGYGLLRMLCVCACRKTVVLRQSLQSTRSDVGVLLSRYRPSAGGHFSTLHCCAAAMH